MNRLFTIREVADYLQMSKEKIYKLAQTGRIPVVKIENQWRFRHERLQEWIEGNEIVLNSLPEFKLIKTEKVGPFLKWAGGKNQLLNQYETFFPQQFNNYLEPFVGAGAVFFHLFSTQRLVNSRKIVLIDSNPDLINCYSCIEENVQRLIELLKSDKYINKEDVYYKIRAEIPKNRFEKAARMIYLNKTCFNGLYRVNSQGIFNVPFGRYNNPLICDEENLKAVSFTLKNVEIFCSDFQKCLEFASKDDFIYFDPPYQPLNKTSNFTNYTKNSFAEPDQEELAKVFYQLGKKGCKVMLSNSDTPLIRKLYKNYRFETVYARRIINCKSTERGKITELVILNY